MKHTTSRGSPQKHSSRLHQRCLTSCAPRRNPHALSTSEAARHSDAQAHSSNSTTKVEGVAGIKKVDTEAGMLSGISRKRSVRSSPYWFTESCNSQCLSHFAAPFIVVRAETSIAESCKKKVDNHFRSKFAKANKGKRRVTTGTERR